jgi:exodeoxyribonuclease VII large subunit
MAELVHPERPLTRGFVRVTDRAGKTLLHAAAGRAAGAIVLHFAEGRVGAQVGDSAGPQPFRPAKRVERKAGGPYLPGQADLFGDED